MQYRATSVATTSKNIVEFSDTAHKHGIPVESTHEFHCGHTGRSSMSRFPEQIYRYEGEGLLGEVQEVEMLRVGG